MHRCRPVHVLVNHAIFRNREHNISARLFEIRESKRAQQMPAILQYFCTLL